MTNRRYAAAVDFGLSYVKANATAIHLLPAGSYADRAAILAASLGHKTVTAGGIFLGAVADATLTPGRKLTTVAVSDGVVTAAGSAAHWAIIASTANGSAADVALLAGDMVVTKAVSIGAPWTLGAFDVPFPSGGEFPYVGPGDVVTGAVAYWGLRGYNDAYATGSGPGIDIVDDAGTTTTTLNILSNGSLDVASVPGSGGPFRVSKVYDQVGTNHLVQVTHAARPILTLNAVGTRPALLFGAGTGRGMASTATITQAVPYTVSSFYNATDSVGAVQVLWAMSTFASVLPDNGQPAGGPMAARIIGSEWMQKYPLTINVWRTVQAVFNGASSDFNIDGVAQTGTTGTANVASQTIHVGSNDTFTGNVNGYITEIGMWPTAFAAVGDSDGMNSNQQAWWS